jgi:hypothetical protein
MKRLGLMGAVAVLMLWAALSSVLLSAGASAALTRPGPPSAVHATFVAGVPGVTVSWSPPVSDGGSRILYYLASNYSGKYSCIAPSSGPDACRISGLKIGKVLRPVRLKAVNATGPGQVAVILPVVTPNNGATSSSNPSGSPTTSSGSPSSSGSSNPAVPIQAGVNQPTSTPSSNTAADSSATGASANSGVPAVLPFTGAYLGALFALGVGLVLSGLLILSTARRRLPATARRPIAAGGGLSTVVLWFFGL